MKKRPFLVAEISANHCGSLNLAKQLIKSAKKNGADAVKLQTYTPETMTINSNNKYYKYSERSTGTFKRRFNIKNLINNDKITATSKNGLLEILLPKLEKDIPKEKNIKIN